MNATTNGPRITAEHIAAVMEALMRASMSERGGPVTKAGLSMMTGLSGRVVEATIEVIRRNSIALIASSSAPPPGYWLPRTLAEAEANVERRHARALHQLETLQGERTLIRRARETSALAAWEAVFSPDRRTVAS